MRKFMLLVMAVVLCACGTIQDLVGARPQDIDAVQALVPKQQEAVDLAFDLHKQSLKNSHDMGLEFAISAAKQARAVDLWKAWYEVNKPEQENSIPDAKRDEIQATYEANVAKYTKSWNDFVAAGERPKVWDQLDRINEVLNQYLLNKLGAGERQNKIALDVHDLIKKEK